MDLATLIRQAANRLQAAGVPTPRVDAELLAGHVLNAGRGEIQARAITGGELSPQAAARYEELVAERARRIPLQHLTGSTGFRQLNLQVGPGVFIPRPETETVVEAALAEIDALIAAGVEHPRVIDLGTGSGAIAASIATERPQTQVHAVEVSAEAAAWAELNFRQLPAGSAAVTLHRADLRQLPAQLFEERFDVVVSNPPYIPESMEPVDPEVAEHDPELALYGGGEDGLELPRAVIATALKLLRPAGWFILEHAEVQAEALQRICQAESELREVTTHRDLTGRQRATSARLGSTIRDRKLAEGAPHSAQTPGVGDTTARE